ncbi:histidine phosphatase family protein [Metabacillus sp. 113a]|uniref:histidine phosphatase family protein n=1 Tax=Metabacillus sp. 113a TaxID=3404706 RepID=UPI003CEF60AB
MDGFVAVTLLRHGLTEKNSRNAYIGWTDDPLSKEGEEQLRGMQIHRPDLVVTSGMTRANQTADILFPEINPTRIQQIKELNFGKWEGLTYEDLKEDPAYREWVENADRIAPPGGETFTQFKARIMEGWGIIHREMTNKTIGSALVVSHGGPIRQLLTELGDYSRSFWEWPVHPGTGYKLTWTFESFRRGERCISLQEVPAMAKQNG